MLNPYRLLVIDSSEFSQNFVQHLEWYKNYQYFTCKGFPSNEDVEKFIQGLTHVFVCENPYNFNLIYYSQQKGIKTYCQSNYEFCDNLDKPYLPVPTKFLMPSYWKIKEMKKLFGEDRVIHLPPPIDPKEFENPRKINIARRGKPRFLHIIGTAALMDRNGTMSLLEAVSLSKGDYELVIKSQHPLPIKMFLEDSRVKYEIKDVETNAELYEDFDAMILPRRYGGLCLTMNEALLSGLPVIMTNISPNSQVLPGEWLIGSKIIDHFNSRVWIDVYCADYQKLADKIDWWAQRIIKEPGKFSLVKEKAVFIGIDNFSEDVLRPKYNDLWI